MRHLRIDQLVSGCLVIAGLGLLAHTWYFKPSMQPVSSGLVDSQVELVGLNPLPIYALQASESEDVVAQIALQSAAFTATLSAQTIYVMDVPTASILLEKKSDTYRSPASTTKLMTALVSVDIYEQNQVLTVVGEGATDGATMGLQPGEQMTVENLLAGLLVQSGNDAAMLLANNHSDGAAGFVSAMNQKAQALGLTQTQFANPSGIDGVGHYSSARDLAILSREVMKHPLLMEMVKVARITVSDTRLQIRHGLQSTNELLLTEPGVKGIKTGTTDLAGEVLITQLERDGREVLVVVMGSQNRYGETKLIYNWIFDHYSWKSLDSGTLK